MRASYAFTLLHAVDDVQHAVDRERCRFLPAIRIEVREPGEPQLPDVLCVDARERAEALLVVRAAHRHPLIRFGIRLQQTRGSDGLLCLCAGIGSLR